MSIISKYYNLLFYVLLFKIILSQQDIYSNITNIISLINDKIIEIFDNGSNELSYSYHLNISDDIKNNIKEIVNYNYNRRCIYNKNIIRINETHFIFFELNEYNEFCYGIYELLKENNDNIITKECFNNPDNLNLTDIEYLEGNFLSKEKLFLSAIINNTFVIIMLDLNNDELKINMLPENIINMVEMNSYKKNKIQCDSYDGINYFCILSFKGENDWKLFYIQFELNNLLNTEIEIICDDNCFSGNIIKINDLNSQYLVCYKKYKEGFLYIICKNYSIINNNIIINKSSEVFKTKCDPFIDKQLLLYIYKYSIFIQFDIKSNNSFKSILIICSLDLKINIKSIIADGNSTSIINMFNDDNNLYFFYEEQDFIEEQINIKIKNQKIMNCLNIDSISLSMYEKKEVDFINKHINDSILFSLDENIKLYKEDEIINLNENNYIYLENGIKLQFEKVKNSGVFKNYYSYTDSEKEFHNNFSLICPLNITICYSTCQACLPNKNSSPEEHFCTSCIIYYHSINNEANNEEGYNCYLNHKNNYNCHFSCKYCVNNFSCEACKDGYSFKSDIYNNIVTNDICYISTLPNYYLDYSV